MYFCIDINRYKTFLILPLFLFLSLLLTPTFAFASAVTREMALVDQALNSNATTSFNDVRAMNGTISGNVSQRALAGGSAGTISQPISMPASAGAAARSAAGLAGRMAGGFAAAAAGWAVQKLLDGVGYVMDKGSKVIMKPIPPTNTPYLWIGRDIHIQVSYVDDYSYAESICTSHVPSGNTYAYINYGWGSFECHWNGPYGSSYFYRDVNPNYNPSSPSQTTAPATQADMEDAFYKWMINNPTSVTDPIYQALYTPAQTTGWNLTGEEGAHYGNDGITDEMVNNILSARNAALTGSKTYTLNDSVIPSVDGTSTETTTNPDGSKKTTNTSVTTDKGKRTTTAIETTTNPDGTQSTKTTTKTEDVPQTYPAACEWFATACDWFGWTQKEDDLTDTGEKPEIQTPDLPSAVTSYFNFGTACPPDRQIPVNAGGQSLNLVISYAPLCTVASQFKPAVILMSFLAGAFIVTGTGRRAEVGD